ncbi:hypothetical protein P2G82_12610 [Citrobacter braakii]|uniref:hypothetical protein n=1 Tax=Citrobacter braakii TaxID=57706 RepID=UPI0024DE0980|nr:hypothetical protein [Citrobacter braakii]MDK2365040.1 hypothetical protein [Citrobacter braakii]
MKKVICAILLNVSTFPALANTAIILSCPQRQDVTISRFSYGLSTMKWDDNFIVASGIKKDMTENDIPFRVTHFVNGDDLFFFPEDQKYILMYAGNNDADRCRIIKTLTYPVATLPREIPNS